MSDARGGPSQFRLEHFYGMLRVKAANIAFPEEIEIWFANSGPPQPQLLRLSPALSARQPLDFYQH